ncbi:MAG TPA: DUF5670 family protein [Myxococcaceae bacterium]|nr:DUF5670 family protein [Myxococcaceae bacterium]
MLWTNGCILLMLWALGYVAGGTVGEWVHLLLGLSLLHFALALLKAGRHLPRSRGWASPPRTRAGAGGPVRSGARSRSASLASS